MEIPTAAAIQSEIAAHGNAQVAEYLLAEFVGDVTAREAWAKANGFTITRDVGPLLRGTRALSPTGRFILGPMDMRWLITRASPCS